MDLRGFTLVDVGFRWLPWTWVDVGLREFLRGLIWFDLKGLTWMWVYVIHGD